MDIGTNLCQSNKILYHCRKKPLSKVEQNLFISRPRKHPLIILISCICVIVYLGEAVQHIPPPEETDLGLDVRDGQES